VSGRIAKWLLLFLEYGFTLVYKLGRTHVVAYALSKLPYSLKPLGVLDETMYASLFYVELIWI
jgi:hypothetical protein